MPAAVPHAHDRDDNHERSSICPGGVFRVRTGSGSRGDSSGAREHLLHIGRDEFEVQTFRSGGKGGQHQNKTDSGVRIIHRASGARGESRSHRSQHRNRAEALRRLAESTEFWLWLNRRIAEIDARESVKERVERMMAEENIRVEVRKDDRWTEEG